VAYVPKLPYSDKRSIEPARIVVPPPSLDYDDGKACFNVAAVEPFEHGSAGFGNPAFLRAVTSCHKLEMSHGMLSWKYEMRRQAQHILPFLLLGPSSTARDARFVQKAGITFMLAVRSAAAVKARPSLLNPASFASSKGVVTATFDLDTPYDLITNLRPTIKRINDHLEESCIRRPITSISDIGGKVLVFCESGNERSTVIVAAYLMVLYGVDAITAIQIIQSQRFCINVEDGMKRMLLDLQEILRAERQVALSNAAAALSMLQLRPSRGDSSMLNKPTKRSIDRAYESEGELSDAPELTDGAAMRSGTAPFADAGD